MCRDRDFPSPIVWATVANPPVSLAEIFSTSQASRAPNLAPWASRLGNNSGKTVIPASLK